MKWLVCLLFLMACDVVEEDVLWDSEDDEYALAQRLAISECVDDSAFFSRADTTAEFENSKFSEGDIFKISQDANNEEVVYVKVNRINGAEMELIYHSSNPDLRKILSFEETDHEDIVTFLKTASCNEEYDSVFEASGLDNVSEMSFTWEHRTVLIEDDEDDDDSNPEAYRDVTKKLKVNTNYPLFFYFYNGTKTYDFVLNDGDEEKSRESKITITEVTDADECENNNEDQSTYCDFDDLDTSDFPNCELLVDNDAYNLTAYNTKAIGITGDSECELLESMGSI